MRISIQGALMFMEEVELQHWMRMATVRAAADSARAVREALLAYVSAAKAYHRTLEASSLPLDWNQHADCRRSSVLWGSSGGSRACRCSNLTSLCVIQKLIAFCRCAQRAGYFRWGTRGGQRLFWLAWWLQWNAAMKHPLQQAWRASWMRRPCILLRCKHSTPP